MRIVEAIPKNSTTKSATNIVHMSRVMCHMSNVTLSDTVKTNLHQNFRIGKTTYHPVGIIQIKGAYISGRLP